MQRSLPPAAVTLPALAGAAVVVWAWLGAAIGAPDDSLTTHYTSVREAGNPDTDLRELLHTARVRMGTRPCTTWTGSRWACGPSPWHFVGWHRGRATTSFGIEDRACIWAHPEAGAPARPTGKRGSSASGTPGVLSITFPAVPLGAALYGEAAILDSNRTGEPVEVAVHVAGQRRGHFRVTDKRGRRWVPWRVPTARESAGAANPDTADVELRITTRNPSWRHLCFTAFATQRSNPPRPDSAR